MPKFRAWLKSAKEMVEVLEIDFYNKEVAYIWTEQVSDYELEQTREVDKIDDLVLMQSTGLKDKNNVDIYTGDILDIKANFKRLGFVIFDHGKFKVQHVEDTVFYDFTQVLSQCEVIGNVFENKELLEEVK